jgi:hypothetical protein|uniref:Uncharacterized protein n=1 Tax=Podoviridae sp. ct4s49 TaxID=2823555 RepID=A0A8S5LEL3_9CAUD|nr:MAG TPA: hypothetical protein [Podoviridae sp. ct4s49]
MLKVNADRIALVMARDILKSNSQYQVDINPESAEQIAGFIETLSRKLQNSLEDFEPSGIIDAHKSQSAK